MTREEITEGLRLLEDNMVYFDELLNDKCEYIDVHELLFEAIEALSAEPCEDCISRAELMNLKTYVKGYGHIIYAFDVNKLKSVQPINQNIKALGEELRTFRDGIKDEKVLTGFNMAIALCNKHLADMRGTESEG